METSLATSERAKEPRSEYLIRQPLSPALPLALGGIALIVAGLLSPPTRTGMSDPAAIAAECTRMDAEAVASMAERRIEGPAVGKQIYVRTAPLWLAEARRSCAAGMDARAARFYRRMMRWQR